MMHSRAVRLLAALPTVVVSLAAVTATAHAQDATPPASSPAAPPVSAPAAPPAGAQPAPGFGPPPGYQPPPGAPAYGYPPPGAPAYGYPPPGYAQPAYGQPSYFYPPPSMVYAAPPNLHDGFYLRLHLGGSYLHLESAAGSLSGPGGSVGVALGGVVAPDLILYGAFFMSSVTDPTEKVDGYDARTVRGVDLAMVGLGGGLAYYLPSNVYFAGTLAMMQFSLGNSDDNSNLRYDSQWGLGGQVLIGKEWWVSQDWGLGVAGEAMAASMKDQSERTWTGTAFSLLFSATYN